MSSDKKKHCKKKVNKLGIQECESILKKLDNQRDSLYYNHVLEQYRRLIPSHSNAVILSNTELTSAVPFSITKLIS